MNYLLILLAVSMLVSGLGWIYFIYFFSIGYGFGISALAANALRSTVMIGLIASPLSIFLALGLSSSVVS